MIGPRNDEAQGHAPDPFPDLPAALKAHDRFIVWRWEQRPGELKPTKVPTDPVHGGNINHLAPSSWMTYAVACEHLRRSQGHQLGFVLGRDDATFCGIDLDGVIDANGKVDPAAQAIVARLASYTEVTPSGHGLRVWVQAIVPFGPGSRKRTRNIEIYSYGRFFTLSGQHYGDTPKTIEDRQDELDRLRAELFPATPQRGPRAPSEPCDLDDQAIIEKLKRARNSGKFEALFRGDVSGYPSGSEADLALCSLITYYTQDVAQVERIFNCSGLNDDKWAERRDYRDATLAKALDRSAVYDASPGRGPPRGDRRPSSNGNGNGHTTRGASTAHAPGPCPNEAVDDPHRLARLFLDQEFQHRDARTLVYHKGEFLEWGDGAYHPVSTEDLRARLTRSVKAEFDRANLATLGTQDRANVPGRGNGADGKPGPRPKVKKVTGSLISNVLQALQGYVHLAPNTTSPSWLCDPAPFPALEALPARNTIVSLPGLVTNIPGSERPLTPLFFGSTALDYDFDREAPLPLNWLTFLGARPLQEGGQVKHQIWPDDPESIGGLQEWFGYLLTPDTRQQKILMLIGPRRSGKGTIARVLRALIGAGNVAMPTLSSLSTNFGLAPLIGKPVAIISDARLSSQTDVAQIVERLLSISGEDAQTIDRKHKDAWSGTLAARFTIISNELPSLADTSGALAGRLILLRLTRSFFGVEDGALTAALLEELPGILLWALAGWARLRERGRFVQPESGFRLVEDFEDLGSPVGAFLKDCCVVEVGGSILVSDLFAAWLAWCERKGRKNPGTEHVFGRNLRAAVPGLEDSQARRTDGKRPRFYEGVRLRRTTETWS